MFIAPDHPAHQRRSEERNESSEYHSSYVPLLRTALRTLSSRGYKHDTPAGVKSLASCHSAVELVNLRITLAVGGETPALYIMIVGIKRSLNRGVKRCPAHSR